MSAYDVSVLPASRAAQFKTPYTLRRVPASAFVTLLSGDIAPRVGDLVLARVDRLGQHRHLELASGRRARLFEGDEIVLAYGNRYAPDQFEAEVPADLGPCHLVAAGGVAARVLTRHDKMRGATTVQPVGLLGDRAGHALNLADFALERPPVDGRRAFTVAVVGTSMNAGKTETAANLIRGFVHAGLHVGAAKVTGTGAGGDVWAMADAGARTVLDFTDAGLPSTYLADPARIERVMETLLGYLYASGAEAVVFEVADGLFQRETADLLRSPAFARAIDAVVFAAGDAMGSAAGVQWLRGLGLPIAAASGLLTASPLAMREVAAATGLAVLDLDALRSPSVLDSVGFRLPERAAVGARG